VLHGYLYIPSRANLSFPPLGVAGHHSRENTWFTALVVGKAYAKAISLNFVNSALNRRNSTYKKLRKKKKETASITPGFMDSVVVAEEVPDREIIKQWYHDAVEGLPNHRRKKNFFILAFVE
jgi:hypothetical protein